MSAVSEDLIDRAREFAVRAHKRIDHRRKYNKQPYDVHLRAVAELVRSVSDDHEVIAAAWLHDTVEDTTATFRDIENEFGPTVAELVSELTDASKPGDGNRAVRKSIDRAHLAKASDRAKTVKLADLIDNCVDICRHDRRFAKVYLIEVRALLDVLTDGDPRLYERARKEVDKCARSLGLQSEAMALAMGDEALAQIPAFSQQRVMRLFSEAFTAKDIAEPLRSFDAAADALETRTLLEDAGLSRAGVRLEGVVSGYILTEDLQEGECGHYAREFAPSQVVSVDSPLSDVVHVLTRYQSCYVSVLGGVDGVITRSDVQKPVARMWLFGMITLIELNLTERIRETWPDGSWHDGVSKSRLEKAETLMEERRRRGQACDLLDCLQLSDKAHLLLRDESQRAEFGFYSRSVAKQVIKELESLRNNLAHGQDIVTHDWAQIARMTQRIESSIASIVR